MLVIKPVVSIDHTVVNKIDLRLIPAQYVKPFVKSQKNDTVDAEGICEAALRPQMRFVSPNSLEQQDLQNIHRVRARLVKQRVMLCNQGRGLLLEYGIIVRQGVNYLTQALARIIEEAPDSSRVLWKELFAELREELNARNVKIYQYDKQLKRISKEHPVYARLEQSLGVVPTTPTLIVAAVGNPHDFKNGGRFSAWL